MDKFDTVVHEMDLLKASGLSGSLVSMEHDSPWQTDDRAWFAARPGRGYRLRRSYEDETGVVRATWLVVKQVDEGARVKLPIQWSGANEPVDMLASLARMSEAPSADNYHDLIFALIWQGIANGKPQPLHVVLAQAKALQSIMSTTRQ
jgi:hypothetical protein